MKRLIMINGAMGVGKSAVSRQVQRLLPARCWTATGAGMSIRFLSRRRASGASSITL